MGRVTGGETAEALGLRARDAGLPVLVTVGHGTLSAAQFGDLVTSAGVRSLTDIRTAPGSRRNPAFCREALEDWLPEAGVACRWEPRLGGFRKPVAGSANTELRNLAFRGYADYMGTQTFRAALAELVAEAREAKAPTSVMCAESLWWRCHRRLVADACVLVHHVDVHHLMHDGRMTLHRVTPGARVAGDLVVYDGGQERLHGAACNEPTAPDRLPGPPPKRAT